MPTWSLPAERTTADSTIVADLNKIRDIIQLLGGNGTSQPTSDIEALKALVVAMNPSPVGAILPAGVIDTPSGWLLCDGSALDRTTYATLYAAVTKSLGTVTISNGANATVTLASGNWTEGQCIELTTTGALPTGLSVNTNYYIHVTGDTTIANVSASRELLQAGTYITTSSAGSGVHTARLCPWGISTAANFLLPDPAGLVMVMPGDATVNGRTKTGPTCAGAVQEDQMQKITGAFSKVRTISGYAGTGAITTSDETTTAYGGAGNLLNVDLDFYSSNSPDARASSTTAGATRENRIGANYYIKYE